MTYTWESPLGEYRLTINSNDNSLRPWDAADEYLLEQLKDYPEASKILIINDSYGALGTALGEKSPFSWNDSFCSRKSISENISSAGTELPTFTGTVNEDEIDADLILMKIPKSTGLFEWQLEKIRQRVPAGTTVLAAAHSRNLPPSFFESFCEHNHEAAYSRIWKKSRFYSGKIKSTEGLSIQKAEVLRWKELEITALPGVFSQSRIDPGTQFLLEHFPRVDSPQRVIDPGCGAGVLASAAALTWPEARITATDDSAIAVESTRLSAVNNGYGERIEAIHTDILEGVEKGSADLVICNPPFHQQQKVSVESGLDFIRESARVLKKGGQLFLVANRHLGYQNEMQSLFEGVMIIAQNKQYRIYMCRK